MATRRVERVRHQPAYNSFLTRKDALEHSIQNHHTAAGVKAHPGCHTDCCLPSKGLDRDIIIARDGDRYRLLHGQLRLASRLSRHKAVCVDVKGEGPVRISRADGGLQVERAGQRLPLSRSE